MSSDQATSGDAVHADPVAAPERSPLKLALMGLAGASIEWYDFLLYGTAAALVFPTVFFPANMPPFVSLIASLSTFAVGFVARPFGAVLFGHMGDRVGRKATLATALVLMGVATTLIAFLPSYRSAGVFSSLALVLLRLLQGLAVGGQWGGAALLATESAPKGRRGWYGGIAQAAPAVGVLLANVAFLAASGSMSPEAFLAYGWRIPFLLSVVLVGLGLYVHFRVEETHAYRKLQLPVPSPADAPADPAVLGMNAHAAQPLPRRPSPIIEALRMYPGRILLAAGVFVPSNAGFYLGITYVVAYGTSAAGLQLPRSIMLGAVLISSVVSIPVGLLAGNLSDRYGRRRVIMTGVMLLSVSTFAMFALIETRSFLWISVALAVSGSLTNVIYAPLAAMFAELFDTRVRYSAMSLAYQLAAIAGGAVTPILATSLYARYHTNVWIATYMAVTCAVALACVIRLKETVARDLEEPSPLPMAVVVSN
ncbi:MAG: MFS transporter [Steroidobacteraceae bacterium]